VSKIDDAQTAISAAKDSLDEAITAIKAAAQEAEEANEVLEAAGAEANAQLLAQCKDTIEQVAPTSRGRERLKSGRLRWG
jgi:prefoldin subunit 5